VALTKKQNKKKLVFVQVCMSRDSENIHYNYIVNFSAFITIGTNEDSKNTNGKGKHFISHNGVRITRALL